MSIGAGVGLNLQTGVKPIRVNNIRTEGDSLMAGAYGVSLHAYINTLLPPPLNLTNAATGGSTMDNIKDRIFDINNAQYLSHTTIIWDGSQNGITSVISYVDIVEEAIVKLGHGRYLVIPPITPYGTSYSGSEAEAIRIEMQSRWWASNIFDWHEHLINTNGDIAQSEFHDAPTDVWHLSRGGAARLALGIITRLENKGWITKTSSDPIMANGSTWLFDPSHSEGGFTGTPNDSDIVPNIAWQKAASIIGTGNATSLGTYISKIDTASDLLVERSTKGGLHAILSQDSDYVGGSSQGIMLQPNAAIQQYLDNNTDDDWYFSVWFTVTRNPLSQTPGGVNNVAPQSVLHKAQNTGNYLCHMQGVWTPTPPSSSNNYIGKITLPNSNGYEAAQLGSPRLRAIGTTGYSGTQPAMNNSGLGNGSNGLKVLLGSGDAWGYFNNGAAPSIIAYRAYAENLTVSARSFADVAAIDQLLYNEAFDEGGRFYGDSWADPASFV